MPDGIVEYGLPLRRAIAEIIRKHRPDIVITNNFRESWGGTFPNQSDHIAVGRAAIDAVRDAGNRWVFAEQLTDGVEPWGDVRQVWAAGSPNAAHGADTTDTFDRGVESLKAHQAYIDGLGGDWENFDAVEFLEGISRPAGARLGVTYGTPFEVFSMVFGE